MAQSPSISAWQEEREAQHRIEEMDDTAFADFLNQHSKPVGEAVLDYTPLEWIVGRLLPRGALILLAGLPKISRKTLLMTKLAQAVACQRTQNPDEFLGLPTRHGAVLTVNLEDGYMRTVRHYVHAGVPANSDLPIYMFWDRDGARAAKEVLRRAARRPGPITPLLTLVDPLIEVGRIHGIEDENSSIQMSELMYEYRTLAQSTNSTLVMVHHLGAQKQRMRGSTALEGGCDGWVELIYRPQIDKRVLRAVLRDGDPLEVTINIGYRDGEIILEREGPIRTGLSETPTKERAGDGRLREAIEKVSRALRHAQEPLSGNILTKDLNLRRTTVTEALKMLEKDGCIEKHGSGYSWVFSVNDPDAPGEVDDEDDQSPFDGGRGEADL